MSPSDRAKAFAQYKALRHCTAVGAYKNSVGTIVPPAFVKGWTMSAANAVEFDWFHGWSGVTLIPGTPAGVASLNVSDVGVIIDTADGDGVMNCGDEEGRTWIDDLVSLWGYEGGPELLCALDFGRDVNQDNCADIVPGATNDFHAPGGVLAGATVPGNLDEIWTGAMRASGTGVESIDAGEYRLYLDSFKAACRPISPGSGEYTILEVDPVTNTLKPVKYGVGDRDRGENYSVRIYHGKSMTCAGLAAVLGDVNSRAVIAYDDWLVENSAVEDEPEGGRGCDEDGVCPEDATSCNIEGVGWLLCPLLTAGAALADDFYDVIADFLEFDAVLLNTNPEARSESNQLIGTGTLSAWRIMQGFANIAFVIAFLVIVFSQLTGLGVSNWGIKKLLPRAIIAAILVNLSFYICQIAVDLSNIAGYGLKNLLTGIAEQVSASGGGTAPSTTDESTNLAGIALAVLAAGSLAWANVGALIIAVVGAVVSLLTIFVLLVVRKVLIVLLIVIAPLAFVAYLLPNTQPLFDRWRKVLTSLLLLFPVVSLVYGACVLASAILLQIAGDDTLLQIVAYMALVIPLIAVIPLLKSSLDGVGKIGGAIQAFGKGARGAAQGGAKGLQERYKNSDWNKFRQGIKGERSARIRAGEYRGRGGVLNPRNWRSRANQAINENRAYDVLTGGFGSRRKKSAAKWEGKEIQDKAESMAGYLDPNGLPMDPARLFDEKLAAHQRVYASSSSTAGQRRDARIDLAAAQAHLMRMNGQAGAEHARAAMAALRVSPPAVTPAASGDAYDQRTAERAEERDRLRETPIDPAWADWSAEAPAPPAQGSGPSTPNQARAGGSTPSFTDSQGRATPTGANDDYHDGMSR